MKHIEDIETRICSLSVIECDCGYHMGIDFTFIDQIGDFVVFCPVCSIPISTKLLK